MSAVHEGDLLCKCGQKEFVLYVIKWDREDGARILNINCKACGTSYVVDEDAAVIDHTLEPEV